LCPADAQPNFYIDVEGGLGLEESVAEGECAIVNGGNRFWS